MSDQSPPATGQADSNPTEPATGDSTPPATGAEQAPQPETDWKAEAEKYRLAARRYEDRAKANASAAKELEALKVQSMTDTERAIAEAVNKTRADTLAEVGLKLVDAEVRAASAGRPVDADALLEGLDRRRFLDGQGEPDRKAITTWLDRIAPQGALDLGQGARGVNGRPADMNTLLRRAAGR